MSLPPGYQIHNGDLVKSLGIKSLGNTPIGILPVHAYIPMQTDQYGRLVVIEKNPVAYRDQIRAKRICDAARKRHKRSNLKTQKKFVLMGITVK